MEQIDRYVNDIVAAEFLTLPRKPFRTGDTWGEVRLTPSWGGWCGTRCRTS